LIKEILDKFRWHPDYDVDKVEIFYIDRPKGTSKIWGDEIERVGYKFIYLKSGLMIPTHRVVEVRYDGKVVWKR